MRGVMLGKCGADHTARWPTGATRRCNLAHSAADIIG